MQLQKILNKEVEFDLSLLATDKVYANATKLAKQFGKTPHDLRQSITPP